jgi:hypothetical protein
MGGGSTRDRAGRMTLKRPMLCEGGEVNWTAAGCDHWPCNCDVARRPLPRQARIIPFPMKKRIYAEYLAEHRRLMLVPGTSAAGCS